MPVKVTKIPKGRKNAGKFQVKDASGKVHARATTKAKATGQARLLNSKGR